MSTELQDAVAALVDAAQRLVDAAQRLEDDSAAASEISEALAEISAQLDALVQQAGEAQSPVDDLGARVCDGLAAFQVTASSETQGAGQSIDALLEEIDQCFDIAEQALNEATRGFDATLDEVAQAFDKHVEAWRACAHDTLLHGLEQAYSHSVAEADDAQRKALAAHAAQLDEALDAQLSLLLDSLNAVREALSEALDGAQTQRAATQPALDAVQAVLDPLLEQVERVKDLASSVGISV